MKKIIYFILCGLLAYALYSCVYGESWSYVNRFMAGKWKINETDTTITIFSDGNLLMNDTIKGNYIVLPMPSDGPRWIWEKGPEDVHGFTWQLETKDSGEFRFIEFIKSRDTVTATGVPYFENDFVTMYRIYKFENQ